MSTLYKVRTGDIDTCGTCERSYTEGTQLIHLTSPDGLRLGICCLECYEEEQDDVWG